jgi:hypothetical protein
MKIWRMRIACWIPKATDTHSQHVTFIAVPLQQCASTLRQYILCLSFYLSAFLSSSTSHSFSPRALRFAVFHIVPKLMLLLSLRAFMACTGNILHLPLPLPLYSTLSCSMT